MVMRLVKSKRLISWMRFVRLKKLMRSDRLMSDDD